jgi:hypothetical protein
MARVCYVIIAHDEPANLFGLIGSLWNPQDAFLVWLDAKADKSFVELAKGAVRFGHNVQVRTGSVMAWGGFSIVDTTLRAYSELRTQVGHFSHVVLCSGTHVPLLHPDIIFEKIQDLAGWVDMAEVKVPEGGLGQLDITMSQDWWLWILRRVRYRYVEVPALGMLVEGKRETWDGPALLKGSQWHVLRSDLVDFIVQHDRWVRKLFQDVLVADEHAFQWVVAQSPMFSKVRRGAIVSMDWVGSSPRRVTFAEAAEQAVAGRFLFARKAAPDCTINGWRKWASEVLSNRDGANRLRRVAAKLDWTGLKKINAVGMEPMPHKGLFKSFVRALSDYVGSNVKLMPLKAKRYAIATGRYVGRHGPVWLVCAVEPKIGIMVVPALRRPPFTAADDPHLLQIGIPDLWDFVNLPIRGRVYWMITKKSGSADVEAVIDDVLAGSAYGRSQDDHLFDRKSKS